MKVVWMVPDTSFGDRPWFYNPAARLRRKCIHEKFLEAGHESELILDYLKDDFDMSSIDGDVVMFAEQGPVENKIMEDLKKRGIKVVRDHCENIWNSSYITESFDMADKIVCCSTILESITNGHGYTNTVVIVDGHEVDIDERTTYEEKPFLTAVYCGAPGLWVKLGIKLNIPLKYLGYETIVISNADKIGIRWNINTWKKIMMSCDIALCPSSFVYPAKSNVRAIASMALGLPTLCGPLGAYQECITNGIDSFICKTRYDWYSAMLYCTDKDNRYKIGKAAKVTSRKYAMDVIAKKWWKMFEEVVY